MRLHRHHRPRCCARALASSWSISMVLLLLLLLSVSINVASSHSTTNNGAIPQPQSQNNNNLKGTNKWETCASHNSCTECYSASHTCHWCAHDNACHVKGELVHGCVTGASCSTDNNNNEEDHSCSTHQSCAACSSSSWGCHWCSSDEACHAVGSMHGCAAGTNCYAINRCQRLEPERMEDGGTFSKASFDGVGPVAKGVLWLMMGLVLCCSTLCFGGATFLKCAVDDLVGEPVEIVEDEEEIIFTNNGPVSGRVCGQSSNSAIEGGDDQQNSLEIPLMQGINNDDDVVEKDAEEGEVGDGNDADDADNTNTKNETQQLIRSDVASVARSLSSNRATPRGGGSSIKRMYCACQLCYLFTILTTILCFIIGMSYAPREPQYNVCTNELAWKSIVEGMASLKMSASFDLLISVYNPNRFEVDLSNGAGQFHHDGEYVGSFDIPEGKISEKAISDIVVKVTFTPDKWSALSLTSEYYRGNLKFVVGGHAHVKIPGLGNYQFDAKFEDIHVNVNDPSLDDTHLCACPGWQKPLMEL